MTSRKLRSTIFILILLTTCAAPANAQALALFDRWCGTLSSGYTSGGSSLSITSATSSSSVGSGCSSSTVLPSGSTNFYLLIRAEGSNTEEIFQVTNRTTTTLTVTGAQANTSASNHASGAKIIAPIMTSGAFTQLKTDAASGLGVTIASGTKALATSAISSASCTSAQTATATGTLTTDVVTASFNGDPTGVTGYVPSTSGMLTIIAYPTADTVNFKVCNNTLSSITPGAITLNWRVAR